MAVIPEGDKLLAAKFRALVGAVQTQVIQSVLDAAAEEVKEGAAERAPTGRTGRLGEGITVVKTGFVSRDVGPREFYGLFVEKGTGPRRQKSTRKGTGVMPRTPFLRPAMESSTVQEKTRQTFRLEMNKLGAV
jgi:HK97 gp10 family phage protein